MDRRLQEKREDILKIARQYGARNIRLIRAEQEISFLVDFDTDCGPLDHSQLLDDLQTLLGCKVDIFAEQGLHWYIRDRVLADTLPL